MRSKYVVRRDEIVFGIRFDGETLLIGGPRRFVGQMQEFLSSISSDTITMKVDQRVNHSIKCSETQWHSLLEKSKAGWELQAVRSFRRLLY